MISKYRTQLTPRPKLFKRGNKMIKNEVKNIKIVKKENIDENNMLLDFYKYINENGIKEVNDTKYADLILSLGGDGTLLLAAKEALIKNVPIIAVNMGTLGYLAEINPSEIKEIIEKYKKDEHIIDERNFLEVKYKGKKYYGLNEMVIIKGGSMSKLIEVEVFANDVFVNKYRLDGIIVGTPTGSTAYSLSAGGSIVNPNLKAMTITPICPQSLNARPIVINGNEKLKFRAYSRDNDIHMSIDGNDCFYVDSNDEINVTLSNKKIKIVRSGNKDYYSILREKLKWGDFSIK